VTGLLTASKYKVTWKTLVLPLVGLVAFFAYILLFNVDIREILGKVRHIDLYLYMIAAISRYLIRSSSRFLGHHY
jgi:hypothetical protein